MFAVHKPHFQTQNHIPTTITLDTATFAMPHFLGQEVGPIGYGVMGIATLHYILYVRLHRANLSQD